MLKGFTEDKLYDFRVKCEKSYAEKLKGLWGRAYQGEIKTHEEMIKELENLNRAFQDEMDDYCTSPWDLTEHDIALVKESEGKQTVQELARTKF